MGRFEENYGKGDDAFSPERVKNKEDKLKNSYASAYANLIGDELDVKERLMKAKLDFDNYSISTITDLTLTLEEFSKTKQVLESDYKDLFDEELEKK